MAILNIRGGCKVGWVTFDNEAEAKEAAVNVENDRKRMLRQGYDFGYQWPGTIDHVTDHPEYGECWVLVTT